MEDANLKDEFEHMQKQLGATLILAQYFEKGMVNLLTGKFSIDNIGKYSNEEYEIINQKRLKMTAGPLLKKVKSEFGLTDEEIDLLDRAHHERNEFIHNFVWNAENRLSFPEGIAEVIKELYELQILFEKAMRLLVRIELPLREKAGITEESFHRQRQELIEKEKKRLRAE